MYSKRIVYLRTTGDIDQNSLNDFEKFKLGDLHKRKANLFLVVNGNLRAVWKTPLTHYAIEFKGDGQYQYVIMVRDRNIAETGDMAQLQQSYDESEGWTF